MLILKTFKLPLFWKFSIAIAATVILFGSLNLWFIRNQVYRTFENQIVKHGLSIAIGVAEQSVDAILFDDIAFINQLINRTKSINPDVNYIFIIGTDNRIIAHTFQDNVPYKILEVNHLKKNERYNIVSIIDKNNKHVKIRDIAAPILAKQVGIVRVGISEEAFLKEMKSIGLLFAIMVIIFLVLGILGAFVLSFVITNPIKLINNKATTVNLDSNHFERDGDITGTYLLSKRLKNLFNLTDEIDVLQKTFDEMLQRINAAYKDLKNANESLSQSEKMASVGTLAAGLAHEINNPLAGIRNCIRRIESNPDNIRQNSEYISMMSDALNKIEGVVEGMLRFSRKQELVFISVDIHSLIDNSLSLVKFELEKSKINLNRFYVEKPINTYASSNHLEQVFVNVLLNSIDSINENKQITPELKGTIAVKTNLLNKMLYIVISDNGTGVPENMVNSIFDPFFTLKKIKQGTGLGLAVSYNIIKSHNGQIMGANNSDGGFSVVIILPIIDSIQNA